MNKPISVEEACEVLRQAGMEVVRSQPDKIVGDIAPRRVEYYRSYELFQATDTFVIKLTERKWKLTFVVGQWRVQLFSAAALDEVIQAVLNYVSLRTKYIQVFQDVTAKGLKAIFKDLERVGLTGKLVTEQQIVIYNAVNTQPNENSLPVATLNFTQQGWELQNASTGELITQPPLELPNIILALLAAFKDKWNLNRGDRKKTVGVDSEPTLEHTVRVTVIKILFLPLHMTWQAQVRDDDVHMAFEHVGFSLGLFPQPSYVIVDIRLNPNFPVPTTIKGMLFVYQHPNLLGWLIIGSSPVARMIERMIVEITGRHDVYWFNSEAEVMIYLQQKMEGL